MRASADPLQEPPLPDLLHPPPPADAPVFVVGSGRSGTSIFTLALQRGAGLGGYGEGHVLDGYAMLAETIDRFYHRKRNAIGNDRHAITHIPAETIKADIAAMLFARMAALHGGARWVDKTGGLPMLDFIAAAAGGERPFVTIFLYRRAIENVVSRLKKFPQHLLAYHAEDWARIMARWRAVRAMLPPGSFMEVEQRDLVERPEAIAAATAALLRLPREREARIADVFRTRRPQQMASDEVGRVLSLDALDWPEADKALFVEKVDSEMKAWGYGYGEAYRSAPGGSAGSGPAGSAIR